MSLDSILERLCNAIYKDGIRPPNSISLCFDGMKDVKILFKIIWNIFLDGFNLTDIRDIAKISMVEFDRVRRHLYAIGIRVYLKIFTENDKLLIHDRLRENVSCYNKLNVSKGRIELVERDSCIRKINYISKGKITRGEKIEEINKLLSETEGYSYIGNLLNYKKTHLSEFYKKIRVGKVKYIINFNYYVDDSSTYKDLLYSGDLRY